MHYPNCQTEEAANKGIATKYLTRARSNQGVGFLQYSEFHAEKSEGNVPNRSQRPTHVCLPSSTDTILVL